MGSMSFLRAWPIVVALWFVALSHAQALNYFVPSVSIPMSGGPGFGYYNTRYRLVGSNSLTGGQFLGNTGQPNRQTSGNILTSPYELVVVWSAVPTPPTEAGYIPLHSYFAVLHGSGQTPVHATFGDITSAPSDYRTAPRTEVGTGNSVNEAGVVSDPPPTETIQDHKIGFTLTNSGAEPKDYYIMPTDMNGNPLSDLPEQKVTLAPGESRPFSFSRPGTGSGGAGGAFQVRVIQTDWVADPEFGMSKQESITGTWNSVPNVVPINDAVTSPSQQNSGPGTTATQAPAQQTQVTGEAAVTASQANALNQNILGELQRLGATVKAAGDTAHSDAQQMLSKLGTGGTADMSGVEGKLDGVKDSVDGVKEAIEALGTADPGEGSGALVGAGPPAIPGNGIEEAQGETGILGGMPEKIDLMKGRIGLVVLKFNSAKNALPGGAGAQPLDFTFQTAFGPVSFNLSAYQDVFTMVRFALVLVLYWNSLFAAIQLIRGALV